MFMSRLWATVALLAIFMGSNTHPAAGLVDVPPLSGRIVDLSVTLKGDELNRIETRLREFEDQKGSQIAILIIPTTQPEAIEQFAIRVAEKWKIGRKKVDDGAILVIAKNDRALRIEVGYGLEAALTDATSKRIIEDIIVPRFKSGDFYGGIDAGITAMSSVIEGERLPSPSPGLLDSGPGRLQRLFPIVLIAALALGGALRTMFGRVPGAVLTGGIVGVAAWLLAGLVSVAVITGFIVFFLTLLGGRMGMGGWYGGYGQYDHGGGLGGGIRGGGGGFGGGGASGRW